MASLFSKSKGGPKEKEQLMKLLTFIVAGTQGPAANARVPNAFAEKIEKLEPGLIAPVSGDEVDPAGNIGVYATSKGITAVLGEGAQAAPAATAAAPTTGEAPKSEFKLETGIPLPATKRGGVKADIYPFAQMNVGQSFFIPATEANPNPQKRMASTVSSATKRYKDKGGLKFVVRARSAAEEPSKQAGARVFRVA